MKIKWRIPTSVAVAVIVPVEVILESDKLITYKTIRANLFEPEIVKRQLKKNNFFDTFEEAQVELTKLIEARITDSLAAIDRLTIVKAKIATLTPEELP